MLTTTTPTAEAAPILADPSKIVADPEHLVLLAVLVLAIVGYLLYRRSRLKQNSRYIDAHQHEEGHDDQRGHHHQ